MRLSEVIAPVFNAVHDDIKAGLHSEYWLKGGRGSAKSSYASLEIVQGLMRDKDANAIVYRRVGNTLKDSVFSQLLWAIDILGWNAYFKCRVAPMEITIPRTGQRIMFRGADDPGKSKSIKLSKGYFKYLWFEELAEFRSAEDIRSIKQSVLRGERAGVTICTYNPPRSARSWVNADALIDIPNRLVHTSTYLDIVETHPDWIGEQFAMNAETLKRTNERAYRNEYLGEVTGNGGAVFENITIRDIPQDEINTLEWFYQGVDWGYFPDPFQWVRCGYDSRSRKLYILDEFRGNRLSNADAFDAVEPRLTPDEPLTADSAEPKSIGDWRDYGAYWMKPAIKGAGSVAYSVKWLAGLSEIVINAKCVYTANEFQSYEYEQNANGDYSNHLVDSDNHAIDAVRYALSPVWRKAGE